MLADKIVVYANILVVESKLILTRKLNICSMEKVLERYERYSYAERQLIAPDSHVNVCLMISIIYLCIF